MKKHNFLKRLISLMLALTPIMNVSAVTAYAADDVMLA